MITVHALDSPATLSPSERLTLRLFSEGEAHASELDCIALQRPKRLGLVEDRSTGPAITRDGRRAMQRLFALSSADSLPRSQPFRQTLERFTPACYAMRLRLGVGQ
jgi:hypothetical protein